MKTCSCCKIPKELSEFNKYKQSKDGHYWYCKECHRSKQRKPHCEYKYRIKSKHFSSDQLNLLINNCKKRSNVRKYPEFNLNAKNVSEILHKFCETHKYSWKPKDPFKPSIDRLDNSKGYTINNIRIIWLIENYCKNTFSDKDVLEFCKLKLDIASSLFSEA